MSIFTALIENKRTLLIRGSTESTCTISSNKPYLLYPDYTVGTGITPVQLHCCRSRPITAGRDSHPAPEDKLLFFPIKFNILAFLLQVITLPQYNQFFKRSISSRVNERYSPEVKPCKVKKPYDSRRNFSTG